ncbi:hypothetical protein PLEOSDRAFT_1076122 [Pleurotus ostreatus PC15]|uniref:RRN7-type domain-containing protein n=1 Tax=Pleurotus ostreatus (strain PC15) TaxID=1137138 RepID=A0A067NZ00_PLEO1|nr:hypothetical protein PLEOSDRAFT_1076122 [Pleurotus ostreatus PC15]
MAPKRRCPVCQSKKWRKEASSGQIVCSEGHVMQNYRNEAADEEIGPHVLKKRTLKQDRQTKERSRVDPKLYYGARGLYHYYQCQQLILRHQVAVLVREWSLPSEFEMICKDVWALHLSLLPTPPSAEPYFHSQGVTDPTTKAEGSQGRVKQSASQEIDDGAALAGATRASRRVKVEDGKPPGDDSEGEGDDAELQSLNEFGDGAGDDELAALLRENSDYSSSSDLEEPNGSRSELEDGERARSSGSGRKGRPKGRNTYEGLQGTLSVLIVGMWILRVPFMYSDIIRLIDSFELPYLGALRLLPRDMALHLTKYNSASLSPAHSPQVLVLHALVSRLAKRLKATYMVVIPEVNGGPLLWRVTKAFGGTPILYSLTKRLGDVLSLPLTLHYSLSPDLVRLAKSHPGSHKYDNVPPELALAITTVIVLKLVYGLDGTRRIPQDGEDPASWLPKPEEFLDALKMASESDAKGDSVLFSASSPMSVADLDDDKVDAYLRFCERALVGEDGRGSPVVNRFFPLNEHDAWGRECSFNRAIYPERPLDANLPLSSTNGDEATRVLPAEQYPIYHARDVFGSLEEDIELVLERVGKVVGVPVEYVLRVLENYERRVAGWWKSLKRRSKEMRMRGGGQDDELIEDD